MYRNSILSEYNLSNNSIIHMVIDEAKNDDLHSFLSIQYANTNFEFEEKQSKYI